MPNRDWFEMRDLRRRPVSGFVWIPLRASQEISKNGRYGFDGFSREFFGLGSLAVHMSKVGMAENLGWEDIGLIHSPASYSTNEQYKPVDVYQYDGSNELGIELVLEQNFENQVQSEWHLNQDLVFALGICREGDRWLRPREAFAEVARIKRDCAGCPILLEIKSEYLKDYLAARQMCLRISWYRERIATVLDGSDLGFCGDGIEEEGRDERFSARCWQVLEGGGAAGVSVAIMTAWRTDVDSEVDIPVFGPETEGNTDYESRRFVRTGPVQLTMVQGEFWKNEIVDPAANSVRVRGDNVPPTAFFIIDAEGRRESRLVLCSEEIGKWLWFDPRIMKSVLSYRGSHLKWYTANTGECSLVRGSRVPFGVNRLGLINVYAYDIAVLDDWQQVIWAGFNISPDGGVSQELLSAQMMSRPANTKAPEIELIEARQRLESSFGRKFNRKIFNNHSEIRTVLSKINRFMSIDRGSFLSLSKDLARIIVDDINVIELKSLVPVENIGNKSIKLLQAVLATICVPDRARSVLTPLVGIYELRLGDAHLPSSQLDDAFGLVGIDQNLPFVVQGASLLEAAARCLREVSEIVEAATV